VSEAGEVGGGLGL